MMMTIYIGFLICVFVVQVQTTVVEQDIVIEFLLRKIAELETNQKECSSYQSKMQLELTYVKNKLQQSERRISELEAFVYDVRSDENTAEHNLTIKNDQVYNLPSENVTKVITEKKNISCTPDPKGILRREGPGIATTRIAFYAIRVNGVVSVHNNEIIRFDTVLHNEGNGFNKETGIFTCPLSGTYFFTNSIMVPTGYSTSVSLIVNGKIKGNSHAYGSGAEEQGSISGIVRCEAGYNVWISVKIGAALYGESFTSFSGFLLWGDTKGSR